MMLHGEFPVRLSYHRSLDGLRGIAILFVLLAHGAILNDGFGFIGVNTFFVLSGFLISSLLITEWNNAGRVDYVKFYVRRALRLLPALFCMLAAFSVYTWLTTAGKKSVENYHEVLWSLFYFTNYAKIFELGPSLELAHTWSLSLEEQFYMVWPFILLFILKRNNIQSLANWILLGVVLSVTIRIFHVVASPVFHSDRITCGLDARADSLLLGALIGVLFSAGMLDFTKTHRQTLSYLGMIILTALCLLPNAMYTNWWVLAGWLIASILAAALIGLLVATKDTALHRLTENPALVFTGKISYGLYIWHFPILGALKHYNLPWQNMTYLFAVLPIVLMSYYLVEKPCLTWKQTFRSLI